VVADSRPVELIALLSRSEQRARWKNCIQVRAYSDQWRLPIVIKKPEDVAQFVRLNLTKSEFVKAVAQPFAPCSFAEWWRGNLRQFHLPAAKLHLLVVQIMKSLMNRANFRNVGYLVLRRNRFRCWAAGWHGLNRILTG